MKKTFSISRLAPLIVLFIAIALFFAFDLNQYFGIDFLKEKRTFLLTYVSQSPVLSALIFGLIYAACVAISAPVGLYMSLLAGFLFGPYIGVPLVVVSATIGASILFVAAKTALGDFLKKRAGPWFNRLAGGFEKNAFSYLIFLRLIPVFPFFIVNVVPAFLGVSLKVYFFATLIGIIPGTFVYVLLGQSIGSIIEEGGDLSQVIANRPEVTIALLGLAVMSFIPILYKKIKARGK